MFGGRWRVAAVARVHLMRNDQQGRVTRRLPIGLDRMTRKTGTGRLFSTSRSCRLAHNRNPNLTETRTTRVIQAQAELPRVSRGSSLRAIVSGLVVDAGALIEHIENLTMPINRVYDSKHEVD